MLVTCCKTFFSLQLNPNTSQQWLSRKETLFSLKRFGSSNTPVIQQQLFWPNSYNYQKFTDRMLQAYQAKLIIDTKSLAGINIMVYK